MSIPCRHRLDSLVWDLQNSRIAKTRLPSDRRNAMQALDPLFLQATLTIASLSQNHGIVGSTLVPSAVRNPFSPQ